MENSHKPVTGAILGEKLDNATRCAVLSYALPDAILRDYYFYIKLLDVNPPV
jgi:hypothetical protein